MDDFSQVLAWFDWKSVPNRAHLVFAVGGFGFGITAATRLQADVPQRATHVLKRCTFTGRARFLVITLVHMHRSFPKRACVICHTDACIDTTLTGKLPSVANLVIIAVLELVAALT